MKKLIFPTELKDLSTGELVKDFSPRTLLINFLQFGKTDNAEQATRWMKIAIELSELPKDAKVFNFEESDQQYLEVAIKQSGTVVAVMSAMLDAVKKAEAFSLNKKEVEKE